MNTKLSFTSIEVSGKSLKVINNNGCYDLVIILFKDIRPLRPLPKLIENPSIRDAPIYTKPYFWLLNNNYFIQK